MLTQLILSALALFAVQEVPAAQQAVRVPNFPNTSCPIMGKPISTKLFAETDRGRIYVCCKSCIADILDDVETAYLSSYPKVVQVKNELCPVTGARIDEHSLRMSLQGLEFSVRDERAVQRAIIETQITLVRLKEPTLVDLGNFGCPLTNEPTVRNAFVLIDGTIVRLSTELRLLEIEADPKGVLAKARAIQAAQRSEHEQHDAAGSGAGGGR